MKKKHIVWLSIGAVAILLAVVAVILFGKGYRVIKVEDFDGDVVLERNSSEKDIFEGMKLKSEDTLTTETNGLIELLVDSDKHIMARENTCFTIKSNGNKKKGKLLIELEYGSGLIEIENKLPDGYELEVETPNATLSVRGTTFEVEYNKDTKSTTVKVTEGKVRVESKEETIEVEAGEGAVVQDEKITHIDLTVSEKVPDSPMTPPISKRFISNSDFPDLLKGGSNYDQLKYMIKVALVCNMDGHKDYLKEALAVNFNQPYDTDVYIPVDGTENVYDLAALNNMFSFLTDEQIEEKHLNEESSISGNRVTLVRMPPKDDSYTAIGLASMYYDENEGIIIEFIAERMTDWVSGAEPTVEYRGMVYLVKDATGKYVFHSIEWKDAG